jgi:hypothetical protein
MAYVLAGLRLESNITVATPKVSLLGGWLGLPRWASLPLDFTVLPGRSKIASLTPVLVFFMDHSLNLTRAIASYLLGDVV